MPMHILDWRLDQWAEAKGWLGKEVDANYEGAEKVIRHWHETRAVPPLESPVVLVRPPYKPLSEPDMEWAAKMFYEVMTHQARGI